MAEDAVKDFFISYHKTDAAWARWLAWHLEDNDYSTVFQEWDIRPGNNFLVEMDDAIRNTTCTIAVLSPHSLEANDPQQERAAALRQDPTGVRRKLIPVRVRECEPEGLLGPIGYVDLVNKNETEALQKLLAAVQSERPKPTSKPSFPGQQSSQTQPAPGFPGQWPEVWTVPYTHNPFFTGRETLLARLHEQFATQQSQVIHGLGGVGKTQLALEYAYRYKQQYRHVLWVTADKNETLLSDFTGLAKQLQIGEYNEQDQQAMVEAVKRWLREQQDWLLIFDNADDAELICQYLPASDKMNGHILLTSHAHTLGALAQPLEMEKMSKEA